MFVLMVLLSVAAAGVLSARLLAGVPIASGSAAVLWLAFSGTLFYLLLLLLSLQASTQRGANVTANLVIFPLMMAGGSFFPFEAMPAWMARIGGFTPNGWAVMRFKEIADGASRPITLFSAALVLAVAGAVAFLLILRKLRRVVSA